MNSRGLKLHLDWSPGEFTTKAYAYIYKYTDILLSYYKASLRHPRTLTKGHPGCKTVTSKGHPAPKAVTSKGHPAPKAVTSKGHPAPKALISKQSTPQSTPLLTSRTHQCVGYWVDSHPSEGCSSSPFLGKGANKCHPGWAPQKTRCTPSGCHWRNPVCPGWHLQSAVIHSITVRQALA